MRTPYAYTLSATALASLLVACGGSSDAPATTTSATTPAATTPAATTPAATTPAATTPAATTPATTTPTATTAATKVSGDVVKGPVDGATVTIKKASDGTVLATTTTKAGTYSADVACACDVVIEVSGGTYTDETTGLSTKLTDTMKSVLTASGSAVTGMVTPLTTMAFTSSFPSGAAVSAATFKQSAANMAKQFNLSSVDITTAKPDVSANTADAYGKVLRTVSQYLKDNNTTLGAITNKTMTSAEWSTFSGKFAASFKTATGQTATYNIDGNTITTSVTGAGANGQTVTTTMTPGGATVSGSGAGGGSGTCGVSVTGTVSAAGFVTPISFNYCVQGFQGGSCDAGNQTLSQSIAGQEGLASATNLKYSYSAACAADAYKITLQ